MSEGSQHPAAPAAVAPEIFKMNPFAVNINPTTSEGSESYLKATKKFPVKDRLSLTIDNGPKIREVLDSLRSRLSWGKLISRVTDANYMQKDVIKNYRSLTIEDVLTFNNTNLGNGLIEVPPANCSMPALDPINNEGHKNQFYQRVW